MLSTACVFFSIVVLLTLCLPLRCLLPLIFLLLSRFLLSWMSVVCLLTRVAGRSFDLWEVMCGSVALPSGMLLVACN